MAAPVVAQAPVAVQAPVVTQVPMVQPKGAKKPMNKKMMMLIGGGLLLTIIGLMMVFRKNTQKQEIADSDTKKVEAIKEDLKKIEQRILGFRVKEGVSPIMDSLTVSAAEVQDFVQNEICAVINHDDAIKEFEKSLILPDTIQCKGEQSVEAEMIMLKENIDKMEKITDRMSPEMKKLVMNLMKNTKKMIEELQQQVCGNGKTEVKKEDVLKIVKNLRLSLCGHVKGKTSKEEAKKKINSVMKLVPSLMFGRPVELEADPNSYKKLSNGDGAVKREGKAKTGVRML